MSVHYEIHCTINGKEMPLVESSYPVAFDSTRAPLKFPTRGGARNYIHKYSISDVRIVRVISNDGAPK